MSENIKQVNQQTDKSKVSLVLLIIALVILAFVSGYIVYAGSLTKKAETNNTMQTDRSNQMNNVSVASKTVNPVIIYAKTINSQSIDSNFGNKIEIYKKIGNNNPVLMIEMDVKYAGSRHFILSPNTNNLISYTNTKIQKIDLEQKETVDLFTAKHAINGLAFSPNGDHLFIVDQSADSDIDFYDFNLVKNTSSVIKSIAMEPLVTMYGPQSWRADNKVIIIGGGGEVGVLFYFDMNTKELIQVPDRHAFMFNEAMSKDGTMTTETDSTITDICNDFGNDAPNRYKIINTVTGNTIDSFGSDSKSVYPVTISPDNKKILYYTQSPTPTKDECSKEMPRTYYFKEIGVDAIQIVDNIEAILAKWEAENYDARLINDFATITNDKKIQIIKSYYQ